MRKNFRNNLLDLLKSVSEDAEPAIKRLTLIHERLEKYKPANNHEVKAIQQLQELCESGIADISELKNHSFSLYEMRRFDKKDFEFLVDLNE